jgi:hypothetical protein
MLDYLKKANSNVTLNRYLTYTETYSDQLKQTIVNRSISAYGVLKSILDSKNIILNDDLAFAQLLQTQTNEKTVRIGKKEESYRLGIVSARKYKDRFMYTVYLIHVPYVPCLKSEEKMHLVSYWTVDTQFKNVSVTKYEATRFVLKTFGSWMQDVTSMYERDESVMGFVRFRDGLGFLNL